MNYIDLFAGCGGLSAGLHMAGWRGLFAIEKNPDAFRTLRANLIEKRRHFSWPNWLEQTNWDIRDLLSQKRKELTSLEGKIDLIVGGPPCQGFSTAGRRHESDHRNDLVKSYLNVVHAVKPRAIMFENVRGFTMKFKANAKEGANYSQFVTEQLKSMGYGDVRGEVLDLSYYGVPQKRLRYIVVATREGLAGEIFSALDSLRITFLKEKAVPRSNSAKAAISDLEQHHGVIPCPDTAGFVSGVTGRANSGLQRLLRCAAKGLSPDSHRFVNHSPDTEEVFRSLLDFADRNRCINGTEREAFGLKKRNVTVLSPTEPAPTVTTIPDDFVHYIEPRVMTVRECARLQTFPDWFEFKGPYTTGGKKRVNRTPRYTQVGNAVPPLFAELMGRSIRKILF